MTDIVLAIGTQKRAQEMGTLPSSCLQVSRRVLERERVSEKYIVGSYNRVNAQAGRQYLGL